MTDNTSDESVDFERWDDIDSTDASEIWSPDGADELIKCDASVNEDDNGCTATKRKTAVLGVLKGYADELQKKRKHQSSSEVDLSIETWELENKRKRLSALDAIMSAFNIGDFVQMHKVFKEKCRADVEFCVTSVGRELKGYTPLLYFWGLLHESFPDAMIKIPDRRIGSMTMPTGKKIASGDVSADDEVVSRVEYVYKLVGTRISSKPVVQAFAELIKTADLSSEVKQEDVSAAITRQLCFDGGFESESSHIIETSLSFDVDNKIVKWTHEILASDTL